VRRIADSWIFQGGYPLVVASLTEDDAVQLTQQREALGGRDEDAHVAVAEDVRDLLRLQQRVDRDERTAGHRRAEHRDHRLDALVQVDRHPLPAPQPVPLQRPAERGDLAPELRV
jgi:aminopeptidase N